MDKYFKSLFQVHLVLAGLIAVYACSEEAFLTGLEDTKVTVHDTSSTSILFKCYQVPPRVGEFPSLYLGSKDGYRMPFSLLRLARFDLPGDTSITVDSAYIQMTLDSARSDNSIQRPELILGYFTDLDSLFSESETNYLNINIDTTLDPNQRFLSTWVEDTIPSVEHVRFSVDSFLIESWADTTRPPPQFILKPREDFTGLKALHSSETSSDFSPFLKVFYGTDSSKVIPFHSDLTLLIPPDIAGGTFDSTRSYAGVGAGLRSLIFTELDSLAIPSSAVILRSNLSLPVDMDDSRLTTTTDMKFQLFSLQDSVEDWSWGEVLHDDIYDPLAIQGTVSSPASIKDSTLTLNISDILQSLVVRKKVDDNTMKNFGFKLVVTPSSSLFDCVAFLTRGEGDLAPRLEVLYATP